MHICHFQHHGTVTVLTRACMFQVREFVDGMDLETIMKNPSLCPSLGKSSEHSLMKIYSRETAWVPWNTDPAFHAIHVLLECAAAGVDSSYS